jgi:hypothetical protein
MNKQISKTLAIMCVFLFVIILTASAASASQKSVTASMGADGHLQVIRIANDGLPYLTWQDKNGGWSYYGKLPSF